eukprot:scaffold3388_cov114-Skeletonema_marinoi.AAC.3
MKFTSASSTTAIFILFSAIASALSAFAEGVERDIIRADDEQGARHDLASDIDLGTQMMRGDDEESNKNVAPDLLGAVQIGFANCSTKTQCTKYGQNSCETIYEDCNKQCKWNCTQNICAKNSPGPSPRSLTRKPTRKPTKKPSPPSPTPGSNICTRSPDYSCYKTGQPECCSYNGGRNCPSYDTLCNNYPEGYTGWDYCAYQPNYNCYPNGGRPSCCFMSGGGTMNCPISQPPCESRRRLRETAMKATRE